MLQQRKRAQNDLIGDTSERDCSKPYFCNWSLNYLRNKEAHKGQAAGVISWGQTDHCKGLFRSSAYIYNSPHSSSTALLVDLIKVVISEAEHLDDSTEQHDVAVQVHLQFLAVVLHGNNAGQWQTKPIADLVHLHHKRWVWFMFFIQTSEMCAD